ncbi:MAG: hypothetical protein ACOVNR_00945 [Chitinophagaceae bacterium]
MIFLITYIFTNEKDLLHNYHAFVSIKALFEFAKQVFELPKIKEKIEGHKTLAILPFQATISYKRTLKILMQ